MKALALASAWFDAATKMLEIYAIESAARITVLQAARYDDFLQEIACMVPADEIDAHIDGFKMLVQAGVPPEECRSIAESWARRGRAQ